MTTILQQLVRDRLAAVGAGALDEFILSRRVEGPGRVSYARIGDQIKALTGVYITGATVGVWHQQFTAAQSEEEPCAQS